MAGYKQNRKCKLVIKEHFDDPTQAWEQGIEWFDICSELEDFKKGNIVLNLFGSQVTLVVFEESEVNLKVAYATGLASQLIVLK